MKNTDNWGNNILIPAREEWEVLLKEKKFNGYDLSQVICKYAERDLLEFAPNPEVVLALELHLERYWYLRLVNLDGILHRVHFENVICEHCNISSGMSATVDLASYGGVKRADEARQSMAKLPIKCCKNCGGTLNRRQTIWFAQH